MEHSRSHWCLSALVERPRAETQVQANNLHTTTRWQLSERYSHLTTHMMLTMLNSVLIPYGLLITAFACILQFWSDKYDRYDYISHCLPSTIDLHDQLGRLLVMLLTHFLSLVTISVAGPSIFYAHLTRRAFKHRKEVASTYGLDEGLWKIQTSAF